MSDEAKSAPDEDSYDNILIKIYKQEDFQNEKDFPKKRLEKSENWEATNRYRYSKVSLILAKAYLFNEKYVYFKSIIGRSSREQSIKKSA